MSTRKPEETLEVKESISIKMGKKQFAILAVIVIFIGSSLAFGVFAGGRNAGSGDSGSGRVHWHADFAAFVNGEQLDFDNPRYLDGGVRQIHSVDIHTGNPTVVHVHPSPVNLGFFFNAIGFRLTDECLRTDDGKEYCSDSENSLKVYVNGAPNYQYGSYVIQDLDKILISYGPKDEDVSDQLASITNIAPSMSGQPG